MRGLFISRTLLIIVYSLLLLMGCSKSLIKKDFENIGILSYDEKNKRVDMSNIPVLSMYRSSDKRTYVRIELDLKEARTFRLVENILKKNIEAYIVIKDHKSRDIAREKIVVHDEDVIETFECRKNADTGKLIDYGQEEKFEQVTYSDTTRYLPQCVFVNETLVFVNEIYTLYIQANLWKENKTAFMNICTSPKFISIEPSPPDVEWPPIFNIKFFVTGYYRPTTGANLVDLELKIQEGQVDLPPENITLEDRKYVKDVEYAFDTLYQQAQKKVFEPCVKERDGYILMEFEGHTDPRLISAKYIEETIMFENKDPNYPDIRIEKGVTMDNMILSQLRAYYTWKYVDALFSKSIQYNQLKKQERIRFRLIGSGPDPDAEMPRARRVDVRISERSEADFPTSDLKNK